jgi:hypothetical protein
MLDNLLSLFDSDAFDDCGGGTVRFASVAWHEESTELNVDVLPGDGSSQSWLVK